MRTTWARYCRNVVPAYRTWAALLPDAYAVAQEPNRSHAWINELPREMLDYRRDIRPGEQKRGPKGVRVPLYYGWKLMRYGRRGTLSRPVVVASQCRHVSHKNPCCAADAQLRFAHDLLSRGSKAKWFLLLDDDVFVHTYALARALATLDPTKALALVAPATRGRAGGCAGLAAAALSRAALEAGTGGDRPRDRRGVHRAGFAAEGARSCPREPWSGSDRAPGPRRLRGRGRARRVRRAARRAARGRRPRVRDRVPRAVRDGGGGSGPAAAARCPGAEAPPDRGAPQDRARGRPEEAARAVPRPAAPDLAPPSRVLRCRRRGGAARRGDVPPLPSDRGVARGAPRELELKRHYYVCTITPHGSSRHGSSSKRLTPRIERRFPGKIERLFVPIFHPGGVVGPRSVLLVVEVANQLMSRIRLTYIGRLWIPLARNERPKLSSGRSRSFSATTPERLRYESSRPARSTPDRARARVLL